MVAKRVLTIIFSLVMMVMICPVSNFFDMALDLCEIVDTDMGESSNKKEIEDDVDELFSQVQWEKEINSPMNKNNFSLVNRNHATPLLSIVSPPPEC